MSLFKKTVISNEKRRQAEAKKIALQGLKRYLKSYGYLDHYINRNHEHSFIDYFERRGFKVEVVDSNDSPGRIIKINLEKGDF